MIKVFLRDAVATKGLGDTDTVPIQAGTRVTVADMAPTLRGLIRFSKGSESLEMPAKVFIESTTDRN